MAIADSAGGGGGGGVAVVAVLSAAVAAAAVAWVALAVVLQSFSSEWSRQSGSSSHLQDQ